MKPKTIVTTVLLLFVAGTVGTLIARQPGGGSEPSRRAASGAGAATLPEAESAHKIIVYYFHGNARCVSCHRIEAFSREAVEKGFADALKEDCIEWKGVNVDEPGNKHFVKDYQLYTKSVVVSETREGKEVRWKNLDRVWTLLRDKAAFVKYVRDEVAAYMGTQ